MSGRFENYSKTGLVAIIVRQEEEIKSLRAQIDQTRGQLAEARGLIDGFRERINRFQSAPVLARVRKAIVREVA